MAEENNTQDNTPFVALSGASKPKVDIAQATGNVNPFAAKRSAIREKYNIGAPRNNVAPTNPTVDLPRNTTLSDLNYNLNSNTSALDGIEKNPIPTPSSVLNNYLDNVDNMGLNAVEDPFKTMKNISADFRNPHYSNQFYERYAEHPQFQNLGFNPFRDNESLYNAHTSTWQELQRSYSQWSTLAGLGFKDAMGFGDLSDRAVAEKYEKAMAIGSSSMGGVGGFVNNLYLNSGYTVGIMGELAMEEAAMLLAEAGLTAATAATFGGTAPLLAANTAAMVARGGRAINKIGKAFKYSSKLGKAADTAYDLTRTLTNFKDASKARKFFNRAGKGFVNLVNPLEGTIDFARNVHKMKNVNGVVKTARGFGAFYKDVRNVRLAFGEGALEGGMVENEVSRDLYEKFVTENGRQPNDQEAAKIAATAYEAGKTTSLINAPVIMLSNKLTFDGLVRPRFGRIGNDLIEAGMNRKILFSKNAAKGAKFSQVPKAYQLGKRFMLNVRNPKLLATGLTKYSSANIAEGLQEIAQETIGGASKDYYMSKYSGDPLRGGYMASVASNLGKQFSAQGFETFMSGFLMGGFIAPVSNTIAAINPQNMQQEGSFINDMVLKFSDKAEYDKTKARREAKFQETVDQLNELYEDPNKYFSPDLENVQEQKQIVEGMNQAQREGDKKTYYDLKNSAGATHILTALQMGRLDTFTQRMEEMKQLSAEEVEESFSMPKDQFDKQLDASLNQAKEIERRYTIAKEKYPNPYDPSAYKQGTIEYAQEAMRAKAWNAATNQMVFAQNSFDNALERKNSILNNLKDVAGLEKTAASDFAVLESLKSMDGETQLLKDEIASYEGGLKEITDPEVKRTVEFKRNKLAAIEKYRDAVQKNIYENKTEDESLTPEERKELVDAFVEYTKVISQEAGDFAENDALTRAAEDNIDAQFLGTRAKNLNTAVNTIIEPNDFINQVEREYEKRVLLFNAKKQEITKSLEEFLKLKDTNDMLGQLASELEGNNMFVDPDALIKLMETGEVPREIYYIQDKGDVKSGSPVPYNSSDYSKAINIFANYAEHIHGIVIGQEVLDPTMLKQHRDKLEGDERRYKDYAEQFGFDPESSSSKVPLSQVLDAIIESEYATKGEIELAKKLLENVDRNESVTFVNNAKKEGNFTETEQTVIDARYSSKEFKGGDTGPALETVILKQELARRVLDSVKNDETFKNQMGELLVEAQEAYKTLSPEDKMRLFGNAVSVPLGLTSVENFVLSSMIDTPFQQFLAMSETKAATETNNRWQSFLKAVLDQINKILGTKSDGSILNASMDLITAKIDAKFGIKGTKGKTSTRTRSAASSRAARTSRPGRMTVEELMAIDEGALADLVYEDFMRINKNKLEDGNEPLLKDFDTMTKEEVMESAQFASFVESPIWKKKEDIIKNYERQSEEVQEEEVEQEVEQQPITSFPGEVSSTDVTDTEYQAFVDNGAAGLSDFTVYKLAEKVKNRGTISQQESSIMADKESMARINNLLKEMAKGYPRTISRSMKRQMKLLGYPKESIKDMNAATMQTYIWQGLTFQERNDFEKAKSNISAEVKQEVNDFNNAVDELFNSVTTKKELDEVEDLISAEFAELSFDAANLVSLTQEAINARKKAKLQELAFSIKIDDISVGEFLSLNNKNESIVEVIAKDADGITVKYAAGKQTEFTISNEEVADKIKYRYSEALEEAMKEEQQEISPEDVEQAAGSQNNVESLDSSGAAVSEEIEAVKGKDRDEQVNNFLDNIC